MRLNLILTRQQNLRFLLALLYLLAFAGAALPGPAVAEIGVTPFSSIILHVIEFTIIGSFTVYVFRSSELQPIQAIAFSILIATVVSAATEIMQIVVPGRCATFEDFLVNALSSLLAIVIVNSLFAKHSN